MLNLKNAEPRSKCSYLLHFICALVYEATFTSPAGPHEPPLISTMESISPDSTPHDRTRRNRRSRKNPRSRTHPPSDSSENPDDTIPDNTLPKDGAAFDFTDIDEQLRTYSPSPLPQYPNTATPLPPPPQLPLPPTSLCCAGTLSVHYDVLITLVHPPLTLPNPLLPQRPPVPPLTRPLPSPISKCQPSPSTPVPPP